MATDLKNGISSIGTVTDNIEDIAFSDVWSGDVYTAQIELLKGIVVETRNLESEFETFKAKVGELDQYKELLDTIKQKEAALSGMSPYTTYKDLFGKVHQKENSKYTRLENEINDLKEQAKAKKEELLAYFNNSVSDTTEEGSEKDYILPDNLDYTNVDEIIRRYFSSNLPITNTSLYKLYEEEGGRDYVRRRLMAAMAKGGSDGRQRSVNAVVELFNLSTAKGVRLPYVGGGGGGDGSFVITDRLVRGVDCIAFVCWGVDKGVPNGFQWRPCTGPNGITTVGTKIEYEDWSKAKSGDVFTKVNGDGYHATYLLQNNPKERYFIIAEASGELAGIRFSKYTYEQYRAGGMELRNLDKVYSGEDQESRLNKFQPHNHLYSEYNPDLREG